MDVLTPRLLMEDPDDLLKSSRVNSVAFTGGVLMILISRVSKSKSKIKNWVYSEEYWLGQRPAILILGDKQADPRNDGLFNNVVRS